MKKYELKYKDILGDICFKHIEADNIVLALNKATLTVAALLIESIREI